MSSSSEMSIAAKYKRKGRASRTLGQLWQVPTFTAGLLAVVVVAAGASLHYSTDARQFDRDARRLREMLADKSASRSALIGHANRLLDRGRRMPNRVGLAHFFAGSVHYRAGHMQKESGAARSHTAALKHLQKAKLQGVPDSDVGPLHAMMGAIHFKRNEFKTALRYLKIAVEQSIDNPGEVYAMLVKAHLQAENPDLQAALSANQEQLKHLLDQTEVYKAWLTRGRIFARLTRWDDAYKALNNIDRSAPRDLRAQSSVIQATAAEAQGRWRSAQVHWTQLTADAESVPGGIGRVWYGIGLAHQRSQPPNRDAAVNHFEKAVQKGGDIAQAARLQLGALYLLGEERHPALAMKHIGKALVNVESPKDYHNKWLDAPSAARLLEDAQRYFLNERKPDMVDAWAAALQKLTSPEAAQEKLAVILETYARADAVKKKPVSEESKDLLRRAAVAYEKAARKNAGKKRAALLWRCAVCYRDAGFFAEAVPILDQYVVAEPVPEMQAKGWFASAQTNQALKNRQQARHALEQCLLFPDTTYAYQARYQLALDAEERGDLDEAVAYLQANRVPTSTTIHRQAHEDSLYKLASLFLTKKDFNKAYFYLQEAARQYPHNPQVYGVRNQLAGVFKKLGEETGRKLLVKVPDHMRGALLKERRDWLKKAADTYDDLADNLNEKQTIGDDPFTKDERRMMQRAEFSAADMYMGLNAYDESLRRYQRLLVKYPRERAGLLAGERIFHCMGFLNATPNERKRGRIAVVDAMAKMTAYLKDLPADNVAFQNLPDQEVRSKTAWVKWVEWVNHQLTGGKPAPLVPPTKTKESTSKRTPIPKTAEDKSPRPVAPVAPEVVPPPVVAPSNSGAPMKAPSFTPPKID